MKGMATHNMYCVGLKRKVDAIVEGVTHMITSKGSKYQIKGHYMDGDKRYNCTSMCSKAVHDSMKDSGVTAVTKDRTIVLDAEGDAAVPEDSEGDGVETPEEVTDIEVEADVEQPEVDDAYTEESGEEPAPSVVEASAVSATADAPEGSAPLEYDPTAETPMDDGGPPASFSGESAFDKLEDEIADEYEEKGMSDEEADKIGAATAYKIGVKKYGKKTMRESARKGVPAASLEAEGLEPQTAFGGDLASLTDFDGVESVVVEAPLGHGVTQYYAEEDGVVADPSTFPAGSGHVIGSQTADANYTPLHAETELRHFGGHGRDRDCVYCYRVIMDKHPEWDGKHDQIVADFVEGDFQAASFEDYCDEVLAELESRLLPGQITDGEFEAEDATSADYDPLSETPGPHLDESAPSDSFEAMAVYPSGPGDVNKGMAALLRMVPSQVAKGNFISWGPKYLTVKEGSKHNKYLLFVVFKLENGSFVAGNAYGRIGYGNAKTWFGPQMSSEHGAIREAEKKMRLKERKKGYNLEFGAEAGDAPEESHPTDYDPLTASPTDEGGPADSFGWSEEDAEAGAFSAEFIANADTMYCAECFESSCGGHKMDAEDGPSPLDYDPLTEAPSGEGGPPAGPSEHFEAESSFPMAAGVALVVGLIASYKYSDKVSDLFRKLGDE